MCRRKLRDPCRVVICLMVSQQLLDLYQELLRASQAEANPALLVGG